MNRTKTHHLSDFIDTLRYRHNQRKIVEHAKAQGLTQRQTKEKLSDEFQKSAAYSGFYNTITGLGVGCLVIPTLLAPLSASTPMIGLGIIGSFLFGMTRALIGTSIIIETKLEEKFGTPDNLSQTKHKNRCTKRAEKIVHKYFN